jgi:hypothetical protein
VSADNCLHMCRACSVYVKLMYYFIEDWLVSNRRSTGLRAAYVCRTGSNISIMCFKRSGRREEYVLTASLLNRDEAYTGDDQPLYS